MSEQWQELKEIITEMRDGDGTLSQRELCKFLLRYMEILEEQNNETIIPNIQNNTHTDSQSVFMGC